MRIVDAQGKLIRFEEQTSLSEIPDKARAAILRAVSLSEVKVDAAGKPVE